MTLLMLLSEMRLARDFTCFRGDPYSEYTGTEGETCREAVSLHGDDLPRDGSAGGSITGHREASRQS